MLIIIDARRNNKALLEMAREARDKFDLPLKEFYRLATLNAFAIEETRLDRKSTHYTSDMETLSYITDTIDDFLGDEFTQVKFRALHLIISLGGATMRQNLPVIGKEIDIKKLRTAPDFLKGVIYART